MRADLGRIGMCQVLRRRIHMPAVRGKKQEDGVCKKYILQDLGGSTGSERQM